MKPDINDMHPVLLERFLKFKFIASESSQVPFAGTCILRTPVEQTALYAQGRLPLAHVQDLRKEAGMRPLAPSDNLYKVTWTMNSKHFPDANGKSRAFDIAVLKNGREATWDLKWDGDKDSVADYRELANLADQCGLVSGGLAFGDWPHFQLPADVV